MEKKKAGKAVEVLNGKEIAPMLSEPMQLGEVFMASGMFKDVASQAQAVVKILAGRELGLAPIEAMSNLYIVNGKVALQAKAIGALIKKNAKYDFKVEKLDESECIIAFYQIDGGSNKVELGKSTFTIKDAAKAGIVNKDVWKNYPKNMLYARALTNGARWYAADAFCGYTVEEVEDIDVKKVATTVTITDGEVTNGDKDSEAGI
jgi:hypothetical protein